MDQQLQQLVEKLRVLARANEPNRVVLIEKAIDQYLNDKAGIVRLSLERLSNAIDREGAEKRPIEDWSIARDYFHSRLRRLA
jgi:predicted transcriptional regulator